MKREVTTDYLEMTDPGELRPKTLAIEGLDIRQAETPSPELNRFLYTAVGGDWFWTDRLGWNFRQWQEWVNRPGLRTWVAYVSGTPAGYFELHAQPDDDVEIPSFGLLPQFTGQGIGGHFLTIAVEKAWQMGAKRVWLHTCDFDHPHALSNYKARGFRVVREKRGIEDLPERPIGPWPGSNKHLA
jgi:GNAT superfamily N-acetyltransferase